MVMEYPDPTDPMSPAFLFVSGVDGEAKKTSACKLVKKIGFGSNLTSSSD
jgi:hypothetical protein